MCGLTGFWAPENREFDHDRLVEILHGMTAQIVHRGPDADGHWVAESGVCGLGHRRLSIQDLSSAGAQPMLSSSGRYAISYNGEVYNFRQLMDELIKLGHAFRGHSDTEVMLAAIEEWGLIESLKCFRGMFAFALFDTKTGELHLARDRLGEKPLYYGWQRNVLLFGSELKAMRAHPCWEGEINTSALPLLLRHNLIPAPHTIYRDITKLEPATLLTFYSTNGEVRESRTRYWEPERSLNNSVEQSLDQAADCLESLLGEVISDQLVSDVPIGGFLSGGIDSSTVVALMQRQASQRVRTFSIGFREEGFNEAAHAAAVAAHLGTEHTELYVSPDDALALIPRLPQIYDEPFADSSQLPTFLISQMTRQHVTVALSGDGGDELFGGYTRYPSMVNAWLGRNNLSSRARSALTHLPESLAIQLVRATVPSQRGRSDEALRHRLRAVRAAAQSSTLPAQYRQRVSLWADPSQVLNIPEEPDYALTRQVPDSLQADLMKQLMWQDLHWYLPDDILAKVDRAAMANSLETRIPMLDHRVVEFALGLPSSLNMHGNSGKQVLKQVLYRHVPKQLVDRPKQGFAVPLADWLRGPLRGWADGLLEPGRLSSQGYWKVPVVQSFWHDHCAGREDYSFQLWSILMFQSWLDEQQRPLGQA